MCLKLSILASQSYITRNIYKPKLFPICLNPTKIKNTNSIVVNTPSLSVLAPYILICTPFFWTASRKHNTGKEPPSWTEPHALPGTPFFWNACHKHHTGTALLSWTAPQALPIIPHLWNPPDSPHSGCFSFWIHICFHFLLQQNYIYFYDKI